MHLLLDFKAFGDNIDLEQWCHNRPCTRGRSARLFISHRLFIAHEMWLLMIVGQSLEVNGSKFKQPHVTFLNFQVSRYVNFITPNFQVFVLLCELWVLWRMWLICEVPASVSAQFPMIKRECMCDHKQLWRCAFMGN
jgi:hypothetical protein